MDINPVRNGSASQNYAQHVKSADVSSDVVHRQPEAAYVAVQESDVASSVEKSEASRKALVDRASQKLARVLPSSETFIIFKNNSGEFITRITNKDTGTVRYLPEPKLVQFLDDILGNDSAVVELQA